MDSDDEITSPPRLHFPLQPNAEPAARCEQQKTMADDDLVYHDALEDLGDGYESYPESEEDAEDPEEGITRAESDELWQQHAGPVLASLDIAGEQAVLAVLFQLMELRRCRHTIEGKGWWGVTAKLVAWIYCSRMRGMKASDCLKRKRKATAAEVQAARPQADWYLFGGAECQIGKTFACVVGAVACQEWHLICICLTYTASVHVKALRDKMITYLRVPTMAVDPSGNTIYSDNLTYRIRAFSDVHGHHTKRWLDLWDHLEKYCWVVSWNSAHQLDTLSLFRLKMGTFYKHNVKARPVFFLDEWDQAFTAKTGQIEQQRDAVLGIIDRSFQAMSTKKNQTIMSNPAGATRRHRLMESVCNIVTTSTPAGLLYVLRQRGSPLSGWAWPPRFPGYMSIEDCRPFIFQDEDVKADNCFMSEVFLEKAVEHSLNRTCNQIGSVGNTRVAERLKGSIHQQFYRIRDAVQAAGGEIHGCIFRGTGHLYIPSDPDMPELNLTRQFGVKNPTDALQWVRQHVGNATIFCGGTMATSSRGVSYYSEDKFGCPTTLLNVTIPRGHCTEGTSQAFMRFCGNARDALRRLGQVDENDKVYVDVCVPQQDLDGCLAAAAWLRTSYQLLKGDIMMGPTSLEPIFDATRKENEDFVKAFARDRSTRRLLTPAKLCFPIRQERLPAAAAVTATIAPLVGQDGSWELARRDQLMYVLWTFVTKGDAETDEEGLPLLRRQAVEQECNQLFPDERLAAHHHGGGASLPSKLAEAGAIKVGKRLPLTNSGRYWKVTAAGQAYMEEHKRRWTWFGSSGQPWQDFMRLEYPALLLKAAKRRAQSSGVTSRSTQQEKVWRLLIMACDDSCRLSRQQLVAAYPAAIRNNNGHISQLVKGGCAIRTGCGELLLTWQGLEAFLRVAV